MRVFKNRMPDSGLYTNAMPQDDEILCAKLMNPVQRTHIMSRQRSTSQQAARSAPTKNNNNKNHDFSQHQSVSRMAGDVVKVPCQA